MALGTLSKIPWPSTWHAALAYPTWSALALVLLATLCAWLRGRQCASSCEKRSYGRMPAGQGYSCSSVTPAVGSGPSEIGSTAEQPEMRQGTKQPYEAFLVLDVEGTCVEGNTSFSYPNEIIEWPVCLLRWADKDKVGKAKVLQVVAEFRSFVKPTWRPLLSQFCTNLTGITQDQVDRAPVFTELCESFKVFLEDNGLIDPGTGQRLVKYCWCSDGPYDVRDFVVKQCFISKVPMPAWITGDVLDVRSEVRALLDAETSRKPQERKRSTSAYAFPVNSRMVLTIPRQLQALGLSPFEGRQHSGIDDTRNIARILIELARRGVRLMPNTSINPKRRWPWMGKRGKILDGYH